jgi:hypothetical protein
MSQLLVATAAVLITRDPMTILPAVLPKHELPILHSIFGEDNVQVLDDQSDADPVELDSEGETTRLENKYGPSKLEETHGKAYKSAITQAMQANVVPPETKKSKRAE